MGKFYAGYTTLSFFSGEAHRWIGPIVPRTGAPKDRGLFVHQQGGGVQQWARTVAVEDQFSVQDLPENHEANFRHVQDGRTDCAQLWGDHQRVRVGSWEAGAPRGLRQTRLQGDQSGRPQFLPGAIEMVDR